jgi:hypothetical protein
VHTRWKAGQPRKAFKRPKREKTAAELLAKALQTLVTITDERGPRTMSAREALVERLFYDAMHGDTVAARQLDRLLRKSQATAPKPGENRNFAVRFVKPDGTRVEMKSSDPSNEPQIPEGEAASVTEPTAGGDPLNTQPDYLKSALHAPPGVIVRVPLDPD